MTSVAWKNLGHQRVRFGLSTGGVAFPVMLILIVRGLFDGVLSQAPAGLRHSGRPRRLRTLGPPP